MTRPVTEGNRQELGKILTDPSVLVERSREMVAYWRALHPAADRLPGRAHFDPADIPALLPHVWLVDHVGDPPRFRCRVYGTGLVDAFGVEITGKFLDEAGIDFVGSTAEQDFLAILGDGRPRWWRGPVALATRRHISTIETVMLPLAADGRRVDMILCHALLLGGE